MNACADERCLLVAPQWIGDAVMAQPLLARLAACGARVTVLALPAVAAVMRAMPGVERVLETPFAHGRLDLRERVRLARELRAHGYARAYVLGNNLKSRLVPWLARIPVRIGWRGEAAGALLTHALRELPSASRPDMREHYLRLAGDVPALAAGGVPWRTGAGSEGPQEPELRVDPAETAQACAAFGLREQSFVALCPGAEYGPAKQWPAEHYARLARLCLQAGLRVVIVGSAREQPAARAIVQQVQELQGASPAAMQQPGALDLCGRTSMTQALALLAGAAAVVSNDSGLMHVAAALGRPTLGVYGSTDPRHTPPAARRSATLWLHLPCSPCFQRNCPLGHLNCLRALDPEWVWSELRRLMQPAR